MSMMSCSSEYRRSDHKPLDLIRAESAKRELADDALGYLEFHIEQGPVLESLDLPLGVVEAISGQSRFDVRL